MESWVFSKSKIISMSIQPWTRERFISLNLSDEHALEKVANEEVSLSRLNFWQVEALKIIITQTGLGLTIVSSIEGLLDISNPNKDALSFFHLLASEEFTGEIIDKISGTVDISNLDEYGQYKENVLEFLEILVIRGHADKVLNIINGTVSIHSLYRYQDNENVAALLQALVEDGCVDRAMGMMEDIKDKLTIDEYSPNYLLKALAENGRAEWVMGMINGPITIDSNLKKSVAELLEALANYGQIEALNGLIECDSVFIQNDHPEYITKLLSALGLITPVE